MLNKFLLPFLVVLILCGCTITPDIENREDIVSITTKVATPTGLTVKNHHKDNKIEFSWSPVDNATYYKVEYQSASDYLSGKSMKTYITNDNAFSLTPSALNSSDTRYIFRVKAYFDTGDATLESSYSEMIEGVLINDFSVSSVINDKVLSFYYNHGKVNSVLTSKPLVDRTVKYYEGNYADIDIPESTEEVISGEIVLGSAENKIYTAALYVDNELVSKKAVTVVTDVDYVPAPLNSLVVTNNLNEGIKLSISSPGINKGVENGEILFLIERKDDDSDWAPLLDSDLNPLYVRPVEGTDLYSDFELTYVDSTAESNKNYSYRVRTYYRISEELMIGENLSSVKEVNNAYRADRYVKSFRITSDLPIEKIVNNDGTFSYHVDLAWEPLHGIPEGSQYYVTKKLIDLIGSDDDSANEDIAVYTGYETEYTDILTVNSTEREEHQYIYKIQYINSEGIPNGAETIALDKDGNEASVRTEGMAPIQLINNSSIKVSSGENSLAQKVKISWEYDHSSVVELTTFDFNDVVVNILRAPINSSDYVVIDSVGYCDAVNNSYIDESVEDGSEYIYRIRAEYLDGDPNITDSDDIYVGYYSLSDAYKGSTLSTVSTVSATINEYNDKSVVTWEGVENSCGYNVYGNEILLATLSSDTLTYDFADISKAGITISFTITALDKNGDETGMSPKASGSILGSTNVTVVNGDKNITVTWNPVANVSRYEVKIYNSPTSDSAIYTASVNKDSELKYVISADDPYILNQEIDNPLSRPYYVSVTPIVDGVKPDDSLHKRVEGSWILPPTGVSATKADYKDMVIINWNSVDGVSAYKIYSREIGSADWKYLGATSGSTTFNNYNVDGIYEYSVSCYVNGKEGPLDESIATLDARTGYNLMKPEICVGDDIGNGIYSVSFYPVKGATSYLLKIPTWDNLTLEIDISNPVTTKNDNDVNIREDGYITYYFAKQDCRYSVSTDMSVHAKNANAPLVDSNYSIGTKLSIVAKHLNDREIINITNNVLSVIYKEANTYFDSDWWGGTQENEYKAKEYSPDVTVSVTSCYGDFRWDSQINPGTTTINEFSNKDMIIKSGSLSNYAKDLGGMGGSGYLSEDPLSKISGTVTVVFPYNLGTKTVTYSDFMVDLSGGSAKVDSNSSVDATSIKVRIL